MTDREKIIKKLEKCRRYECDECTEKDASQDPCDCPAYDDFVDSALALLKEQEAKWIHREDMDFIDKYYCTHFHGMCMNCGLVHDFIDGHTGQYLYCPQCGKKVKWDD